MPQQEPTSCENFQNYVSDAFSGFRTASTMHPFLLTLISIVAVFGTILQLIGLNFWLSIDSKSPFTTAAVVAIFWDLILWVVFALWFIRLKYRGVSTRSRYAFLKNWRVMLQLFIIGALEAAGTLCVSYSALGTSESLQSMLKSTVVPVTAIFTIFVMRFDPGVSTKLGQLKSMCKLESILGVLLILGAVAMLAFAKTSNSGNPDNDGNNNTHTNSDSDHKKKVDSESKDWLPLICFLGAIFNALHFVLQGQFMETFTFDGGNFFSSSGSGLDDMSSAASSISQNNQNNTEEIDDEHHQIISSNVQQGNNNNSRHNLNASPVSSGTNYQYYDSTSSSASPSSGSAMKQQQQQQQQQQSNSSSNNNNSNHQIPYYIETSETQRMSVDIVGSADQQVVAALLNSAGNDGTSTKNGGASGGGSNAGGFRRSDDFTVKISMLTIDTFFQVIFTFICLPLDAVPHFGPHQNVTQAWTAFEGDFKGIFHDEPHDCSAYFLLFLAGFCLSHISFAYLNHYSPTYTPMVMILASPVTNIILLIIPKWNSHPTSPVVWASICSAFLMSVAAVLFARYEIERKKRRIADNNRF